MSELATVVPGAEAVAWREAVHSGRCPVCFLLRREEFSELRHWVGGDVANPENRRRLDEAGGFCNGHFWLLTELHSPQSGALVNDYIAAKVLERLRDPGWQGWEAQAAWLLGATEHCPVCARLRAFEGAHVRDLVTRLGDGAAWTEYVGSRGLCLPHLLYCLAVAEDKPLRERLVAAQAAQVERLRVEMRGLVRKLEGGQRWEATRDEWAAYERATEKLVGRSGLVPMRMVADSGEGESEALRGERQEAGEGR
jgi:hypothetical protein